MFDLSSYNKEKFRIIESVKNYISDLKRCQEISNSVNLPLNFDESIQKLEGIIKSLMDDKVRVSVIAEVSNGKSSFLNALIFKDRILEARVGETTARLYHISYGENYAVKYKNSEKKFNNLEEIKEFIKQLNEETLAKAEQSKEGGKVLNISEDELSVFIYMPLENLKAGIEVIDTPGFGTLNEELMMKFIQSAINLSDAVVIILEISQGMKKGERNKFLDLLLMIRPDKRYIVFNKIDGYEHNKEGFEKVGNSVINEMNEILKKQNYNQTIDSKQVFYVSAKFALQGFMGSNDERSKKYKQIFENFEKIFWEDVINYKNKEFLNNKREVFERVRKIENENIESLFSDLSRQYQGLKLEREAILRWQNKITNMSKFLENKALEYMENIRNKRLDVFEIIDRIKESIIEKSGIMEIIDKIGILDILSKDQIEQDIRLALLKLDMEKIVGNVLKNYYEPILKEIESYIEDYNNQVEIFNKELEEMKIEKFKFPKIEFEGKKDIKVNPNIGEIAIEGINFGSVLGGILTGFAVGYRLRSLGEMMIANELATMGRASSLGYMLRSAALPIGFAIGIGSAIFSLMMESEKKKKEIIQKVNEAIDNFLIDLRNEITKINDVMLDVVNLIKNKFNQAKSISSEIIKMLERAELDNEIRKIEEQLNALNEIRKILREV